MSSTERATYRPSSGWDPPSNLTGGRYTCGPPPEVTDDPLPEFLSEFYDRPLDRINGRKRSRVVKSALITGLLVSAFAILVSMFGPNDMRVLVDNARIAIVSATKDLQATLTVLDPTASRRSPLNADPASEPKMFMPTGVNSAQATVGMANRGTSVSDHHSTQVPAVSAEREGAPSRTLDAETLTVLKARAKKMLAFGDIVSARLLLERAATAQDASAALLLARTYDPAVLGVRDARSITPSLDLARDWYLRAARLGSTEAQQRLTQLQN